MDIPREPTATECTHLAPLGDGWYAIWYPQMGGYCGKAAVHVDPHHDQVGGGCFECYVWHDGEFPFTSGDVDGFTGKATTPARLHHCDSEQFRRFADHIDTLETLAGGAPGSDPT